MAFALTYDNLLDLIPVWVNKQDDVLLEANLPTLIMLAQQTLSLDVKTKGAIEYITNPPTEPLIAGQYVIQKPARWKGTDSFEIGAGSDGNKSKTLKLRTYENLKQDHPNTTVQGEPDKYADYGYSHWIIGPTSDATYNYRIGIIVQLPLLDETNQTNWSTIYIPQLLIYGILRYVYEFTGNTQQLQVYDAKYAEELQKILAENTLRITDGYLTAGLV